MKRPLVGQPMRLAIALVLLALAAMKIQSYLAQQRELAIPSGITSPAAMRVAPGFKVELLHWLGENEDSWIALTVDPAGRLIVSPQAQGCLSRLTIAGAKVSRIEKIPQFVGPAMGLLYARNSLFLDGQGPKGWGVYRMFDSNGVYGEPQLLCPLKFSNFEHGAHNLAIGPDGKLYVICGDHTQLPPDISPASPFQNYAEDQLLPNDPDPTGWDINVWLPEGYVLRMDLDGKNRELFAGGARNDYDLAFNAEGELFSFDNDHNFDLGLPWYRPTRIHHWISGGDFGHRQGSGKFPEYYEDTLPATLNVGRSAPSGIVFPPTNCAFPAWFKDACFMADWQEGRIFAVHFVPRGATYGATLETIVRGSPLNVSAMRFGRDGALYFITGGSGRQSALYRLTWEGSLTPGLAKTQGELADERKAAQARQWRRELETFQGRRDPRAVDVLWPALGSADRWIRYAARVALESQDFASWQERAAAETNVDAGLTAALAWARCGPKQSQGTLFQALEKFPVAGLSEEQRLLKLRALELSFIRQGHPATDEAARLVSELDRLYPCGSTPVNYELCQLLLYLGAPAAIEKSLALMRAAPFEEEQIYYVMRLRNITNGWTEPEQREYLGWFLRNHTNGPHAPEMLRYVTSTSETYEDGVSFAPFLENFRQEFATTLPPESRQKFSSYFPPSPLTPVYLSAPQFVRAWAMADLAPHLSSINKNRHLARGRALFAQAQCYSCHHFGNAGSSYGPDLSTVGSRMAPRDILESILEPSKVIEEQYLNTFVTLKNGEVLLGRVVGEDAQNLFVITDMKTLTRSYVKKSDVAARRVSTVSPMPEGLLNSLTEDEIWDLVACLKAGFRRGLAEKE